MIHAWSMHRIEKFYKPQLHPAESPESITNEIPRLMGVMEMHGITMEFHVFCVKLHGLYMESHERSIIDVWNFTLIFLFNIWKRLLVFIQNYSVILLSSSIVIHNFCVT